MQRWRALNGDRNEGAAPCESSHAGHTSHLLPIAKSTLVRLLGVAYCVFMLSRVWGGGNVVNQIPANASTMAWTVSGALPSERLLTRT